MPKVANFRFILKSVPIRTTLLVSLYDSWQREVTVNFLFAERIKRDNCITSLLKSENVCIKNKYIGLNITSCIISILILKKGIIFHLENTYSFSEIVQQHIHVLGIFMTCVYNEAESWTFSLWTVTYDVNHFCVKLIRTFNHITINQKTKGNITGCNMYSDN